MTTVFPSGAVTTAGATATPIDVEQEFRRNYWRLLGSATVRLGNRQDAEDAVQAAFLKAWEQRHDYRPRPDMPPVAWLATLAKYQALQVMQQRARYIPAGEWAERFADDQEDRDTSTGLPCMADPEVCAMVYGALVDLPDDQRNVVRLHCLEGIDRDGVARCLRIPPADVDWLAHNGMRVLDRRYSSEPVRLTRPRPTRQRIRPSSRVDPEVAQILADRPELLDRLPRRQAEAARLRYVDGLSISQVAARMGVGACGLHGYLGKAAQRIRDEAAGGDVPCAAADRDRYSQTSPHILRLVAEPELMATLPPRWQEALRLRFVERLTVVETARRMETTIHGVAAMVKKATLRERNRNAANRGRIPTVDSRPGPQVTDLHGRNDQAAPRQPLPAAPRLVPAGTASAGGAR